MRQFRVLLCAILMFLSCQMCLAEVTLLPGWPSQVSIALGDGFRGIPTPFYFNGTCYFYLNTVQGYWSVFREDGTLLPGFPRHETGLQINTYPIGRGLNGRPTLVYQADGLVKWIDVLTGELVSSYSETNTTGRCILYDFDQDGADEVVYATSVQDQVTQTYHSILKVRRVDGTYLPNFPDTLAQERSVGVYAIGDMTGDSVPEIIIKTGTRLFVANAGGQVLGGWPQNYPTGYFSTLYGATLVDLDGIPGSEFIDVLMQNTSPRVQYIVNIWRGDGTAMTGWPLTIPMTSADDNFSSQVIGADLNGDGSKEIFVQSNRQIRLYSNTGQVVPNWPITMPFSQSGMSPTVGDVDGDQQLELFLVDSTGNNVQDTSFVRPRKYNGTVPNGFPVRTRVIVNGCPAVYGDFNQDGFADFVQACVGSSTSPDSSAIALYVFTTNTPYRPSPWPMALHDPMHTNCESTVQPRFTAVGSRVTYALPMRPELLSAYPNPFNSMTTLRLRLPVSGYCTVGIVDVQGRQVASLQRGYLPVGETTLRWNAGGVASGSYIVQMKMGDAVQSQRITLVK